MNAYVRGTEIAIIYCRMKNLNKSQIPKNCYRQIGNRHVTLKIDIKKHNCGILSEVCTFCHALYEKH